MTGLSFFHISSEATLKGQATFDFGTLAHGIKALSC